ncbi:ABC transporter substrate-binding protein [Streptomyces sp. NPDC002845]
MGFPSLSAGCRRPACRGWTQGRDACGGSARRLLSGGRPSARRFHKQFRDPDGAWVAGMVIAFSHVYDVAAAGANAPQTPLDLEDPRWKGAIASTYPHDDAALYLFVLYVEKYGWDWVADFPAQEPQFAHGSFSPGTAVSTKQKIIGVETRTAAALRRERRGAAGPGPSLALTGRITCRFARSSAV